MDTGDPWTNLREIMTLASDGGTPIVKSIQFNYELATTRDGTGHVSQTTAIFEGATIEVEVV